MFINETHSTSTLLRQQYSDELPHLYAIRTDFQTAGRGQTGNGWESEKGKNLLVSVLLKYPEIAASEQWRLSMLVAVTLYEAIAQFVPEQMLTIKWPNDIYVGSRKICGILIENSLRGNRLSSSIIGIGLNINQRNFDINLPNPTSMVLCRPDLNCHSVSPECNSDFSQYHSDSSQCHSERSDESFDIRTCLEEFMDIFTSYYNRYLAAEGDISSLRQQYLEHLWRLDIPAEYLDYTSLPSGHLDAPVNICTDFDGTDDTQNKPRCFHGIIRGLSDIGNLMVKDLTTGQLREFGFKEIGYIL